MRSLFLILLLANLVFCGLLFDVFGTGTLQPRASAPVPQLNAERLRIVREAPAR